MALSQSQSGGGGVTPAQLATKQDKDLTATIDNLAKFDANGNTIDAGISLSDLSSGLQFIDNWNANTNTPALPLTPTAPTYKQGDYYIITVAGTFNGIDFTVGDHIAVALDNATQQLKWVLQDFGKNASQISYDNTTSGATSTNLQDSTDEVFERIKTVETRPVGNSGEGKRYFISTPAVSGIYSATESFTESPTTITKTFTNVYQTVFEAETQALNITAIPSGGWNTDISFTHTNDKDFTAKVSFYNGATLLGEIENVVLAKNEKIVLSKTFPTFAFTSGNKLKFKLEAKSNHNGDISVFTNDGTNDLHIHTPVLIDTVNTAVQSALDLKQYVIQERVASEAAMLALTGLPVNEIVIRTDQSNALWQLIALPASNILNWEELSKNTGSPTIKSYVDRILITSSAIPTVDGLYAIKSMPTAGLPAGVAGIAVVGDIIEKIGSVWSISSTWEDSDASIYNKADQKIYNKANTGFNTWNVLVEPLVYTINGTGDNTKSGGYTTYQNAINAYETDFGAGLGLLGVFESYITTTNEQIVINPSNNAQNYYFIGKGTKYRSFTQIAESKLGRNAHRVTMQGILSNFIVQSSGTIIENGVPNIGRGKIGFKDCSGTITIESCDNFISFEGVDGGNAVVKFADAVVNNTLTDAQIQAQPTTFTGIFFRATNTGRYYKANGTVWQIYDNFSLPTYLYIDNSQNMAIHAGLNRIVTKNQTCSNIFEISNNNNVFAYGFVNGVLTNDSQYDAILALGASAAGYYLANYTRTKAVSAVNAATNTLTIAAHGLSNNDSISFTGATLPAPIVANKQYRVMLTDANTIRISDPLLSATPVAIDITGTTITGGLCTVFSAGSVLFRVGTNTVNTVVDRQYYNADNIYYDAVGLQSYVKQSGLWYATQRQIPDGNNINQPVATIASATTTNLNAATSDVINITGTTTITAFTLTAGIKKMLRFAAAVQLTHSANLILPQAQNITTSAGVSIIVQGEAGGVVRVLSTFIPPLNNIQGSSLIDTVTQSAINTQLKAQLNHNYIVNGAFQDYDAAAPSTNLNNNIGVNGMTPDTMSVPFPNWFIVNNEGTSRFSVSRVLEDGLYWANISATVGGLSDSYAQKFNAIDLLNTNVTLSLLAKTTDTVLNNIYRARFVITATGSANPLYFCDGPRFIVATSHGTNNLVTGSGDITIGTKTVGNPRGLKIERSLILQPLNVISTAPVTPATTTCYMVGQNPTGALAVFVQGDYIYWNGAAWVKLTIDNNTTLALQFIKDSTDGYALQITNVQLELGTIATSFKTLPSNVDKIRSQLQWNNQIPANYIPASLIIQMTQAQILAQPTTTSRKFYATDTGRCFTVVAGIWRRYIPNVLDIASQVPLTESLEFFNAFPPVNVLIADLSVYNASQYPALFFKLGGAFGGNGTTTFAVPDWRGCFLRGADLGSGNDPDHASRTGGLGASKIGSSQQDELRSHAHTMPGNWAGAGAVQTLYGVNYATGGGYGTTQSTGGNETRPKNISAILCIASMMIF